MYLDNDTDDRWVPIARQPKPRHITRREHDRHMRILARDAAALWLGQPGVDFVLILNGAVPEGALAEDEDIVDDFSRLEDGFGKGCKVWTLQTKAAKRAAGVR